MKNSILITFGLFVFVTLTTSCTRNKVVAKVGDSQITQKDVNARLKFMKSMSPNMTEEMALNQLIQSYTMYEALKLKKVSLNDEDIKKEWEMRKKMMGNDPKRAEVFKEAEKDEESFKRAMVIPMMAERYMMGEGYMRDEEFHKAEKERAQKAFDAIKASPAKFEEAVTKEGGVAMSGVIEEKTGLKWKEEKKLPPGVMFQGPGMGVMFRKKYLERTPAGSLYPELIDERMAYLILSHEKGSNPKGNMIVKAGIFPKKPFGEWMREQQSKVKVERLKG